MCTAAVQAQNVQTDDKVCSIRHTTDDGMPTTFSITLSNYTQLPYTSQPDTVHYFEFSAMAQDHLLIRDSIRRAG